MVTPSPSQAQTLSLAKGHRRPAVEHRLKEENPSSTNLFFISYSCQQFYFAESLALCLQASGVKTWFDVQRLVPGSDWAQGIQDGLEVATGMVLIASRSALASRYVRSEWQSALATGKPVHVVLFDGVRLPPELADCAVYDLRVRFDVNVQSLAASLQSRTGPQSSAPRLPGPRLPIAVWLVLLSLLGASVMWVSLGVFAFSAMLADAGHSIQELAEEADDVKFTVASVLMGWILTTGFAIHLFVSFACRTFSWMYVRWFLGLWFFLPFILAQRTLVGLRDYFAHHGYLVEALSNPSPAMAFNVEFLLVGWLLVSLAGMCACIIMGRSSDLLRWAPPGEGPQALRNRDLDRAVGTFQSRGVKQSNRPTYRLYYDPTDTGVALDVGRAMDANGASLVEGSQGEATYSIAILSDATQRDWLEKMFKSISPGQLVCVAVTGIRVSLNAARFRRYQWVDYRNRSEGQLFAMANYLSTPESARAWLGMNVAPESLNKLVVPRRVFWFSNYLLGLAALNLATGLVAILVFFQTVPGEVSYPRWWVGMTPAVPSGHAIAGLLTGALFWWLAGRVRARRLTYRMFWVAYVTGLVAMFATEVYWTVMLIFPGGMFQSVWVVFWWFVGAPVGWILFVGSRLHGWLPNIGQQQTIRETLAATASRRPWSADGLMAIAVMLSFVLVVVSRVTELFVQ